MFRTVRMGTVAWVGIFLCLGMISSQGQPVGATDKGEVTSGGTDKREASAVDTGVANKGSLLLGSNLNVTIKYDASSSWSHKYTAEKAMLWEGGYWCSRQSEEPVYWWMSFDKPVTICEIRFEEIKAYSGAFFEFFGSDECGKTGTTLADGKSEEFRGIFSNYRAYHCYGLRITRLRKTRKYGPLASIKNFRFRVRVRGFMDIFFGGDIAAMRGKFFRHAGSRYILFEKETTWNEANYGLCQKLGSNPRRWTLASMPTRNEFDKIATKLQQLRSGSCQDTWIGLMKYRYNNKYLWHRGSNRVLESDDERWAAGEPRNVKVSDNGPVGFIHVEGSQGKILTANRRSTKLCSFLCKRS